MNKRIMKPQKLFLQYKELMSELQDPIDYFLIAWAHLLAAIVVAGVGKIFYEAIFNPQIFNNSWGILDTLG